MVWGLGKHMRSIVSLRHLNNTALEEQSLSVIGKMFVYIVDTVDVVFPTSPLAASRPIVLQ